MTNLLIRLFIKDYRNVADAKVRGRYGNLSGLVGIITNLLLFAPMYVQTNGGPSNATNVLMLEAYKSAYSYNNMGRSYSIVVILIFVSILFLWVQNKFFRITD